MTSTANAQIQSSAAGNHSKSEAASYSPLAIYVHWPFCKKKCPYCDFNSHVRDTIDQESFKTAFLTELGYWQQRLGAAHRVTSIFFGGGTPSLMPPETASAIIDQITGYWHVDDQIEITLEANPTSVEAERFAALKLAGINRTSLGIQSLKDTSLQFLGREHSVTEALDALETAKRHFNRVSFDLIYALPNQTVDDWEAELTQAIDLGTDHLSCYQLTIEENTAFHHAYHVKKQFTLPVEDSAAALYNRTQKITSSAGLNGYEISNYAKPNQASRHNLSYWRSLPYLGIGPGAHGRVDIDGDRLATSTIYSPERWLHAVFSQNNGLEHEETLCEKARLEEQILMGLRLLNEGVNLPEKVMRSLQPSIASLRSHQLISADGTHICVTAKGALMVNYITFKLCDALDNA